MFDSPTPLAKAPGSARDATSVWIVFLSLGVGGEYIGQMFMEVKARPSFIVERTITLEMSQYTR